MSDRIHVWVGTRKGAFVFRSSGRREWQAEGPFFAGTEVHHIVEDPREPGSVYAATDSPWFGPHLHASRDGGRTWQLSENGISVERIPDAALKRLWHIAFGPASEPGTLYVGGDPAVLFRSRDRGETWELVEGISMHPTRSQWTAGAGGMMFHSIEALGGGRLVVGLSAGGAFRTTDDGATWQPFNGGVLADFAPVPYPEIGQCVHKLRAHPRDRDALYQQNHCGVYRAGFGDSTWIDICEGLPSRFGFAMAVPAAEPRTLFTIPVVSPAERYVPEGRLRVARSRDAGATWELLERGLPQSNAYALVLREAMSSDDRDPAGVYFGTSGGALYYTRDSGEEWHELAGHLPPVYSVSAASV